MATEPSHGLAHHCSCSQNLPAFAWQHSSAIPGSLATAHLKTAFAALLTLKLHILQTALTSLIIFILYILFFFLQITGNSPGLGDGRINVAEGGGGRSPPLVSPSTRLEVPGEDRQPTGMGGVKFEDGQIPACRPPGIPRGAVLRGKGRGGPSVGLSCGPALVAPRPAAGELRVGTGDPSWKSQRSPGGQCVDREQG